MSKFTTPFSRLFLFVWPGVIQPVTAANAPDSTLVQSKSSIALYTVAGSSRYALPFWLHAREWGTIPSDRPVTALRTGWETRYTPGRNWKLTGVVDVAANTSANPVMIIPELAAGVAFKNWELTIGRRKEVVGLADSTLGTGPYTVSSNALPIPKIQLGVRDFTPVPFTAHWLYFLVTYSEGLFEKNRPFSKGLRLHQKQLYLRLQKPGGKVRLYGGLNHSVQWGGTTPYAMNEDGSFEMARSLKDYWHVVIAKRGAGKGFDENRIGNHLGSLDVGLEIIGPATRWFFYRQHLIEDGSLFYLTNLADGLNGIRIRRTPSAHAGFTLKELLLEFLYTRSQGGSEFVINNPYQRGKDNYFNNAQVRDGWSYRNRTIGTPFIPPTSDTRRRWPSYADAFTSNNRVSVWHLALRGFLLRHTEWAARLSYALNAGTYDAPFDGGRPGPDQFSGLLSFIQYFPGWNGLRIQASFAADYGRLYPENYGFRLGIVRTGSF